MDVKLDVFNVKLLMELVMLTFARNVLTLLSWFGLEINGLDVCQLNQNTVKKKEEFLIKKPELAKSQLKLPHQLMIHALFLLLDVLNVIKEFVLSVMINIGYQLIQLTTQRDVYQNVLLEKDNVPLVILTINSVPLVLLDIN